MNFEITFFSVVLVCGGKKIKNVIRNINIYDKYYFMLYYI